MKKKKVHIGQFAVVYTFSIVFLMLILLLPSFLQKNKSQEFSIQYATTTLRPDNRPGDLSLIRIQVVINDDISKVNGKILEVDFNNHIISLEPADSMGRRGEMHFQLKPGKYKIKWKVLNDKYSWPRVSDYSKTIEITENDKWIHILITGREIFIS